MVKRLRFRIVWDREALDSLKEILTYLSEQSTQAPSIVKSGILSRLDAIKKNPLISEADKLKDPIAKEFRAFVVYSYRVTYHISIESKEIRILRVRHTSREPLGY